MNCETSFFMLSKSKKPEVVISKASTPKECWIKGIQQLGGITNYISEGDHVFIKFNLNLPGGFPTNTNFDVLDALIISCKEAGAEKIYIGSFPKKGIPIKIISDLLNLEEHFRMLGAELAFLDNSNNFEDKDIDQVNLKKIKYESLTKIKINDNEVLIPNIILNSNKFISVNQINVNPLFKLNLSILNSFSMIPPKSQLIGENVQKNLSEDEYKKELTTKILDVFTIKQPNLVINDLFYVLEGAGPYIYKDSNLKKTSLMILGNDAVSVDLVTLNVLNINTDDSEIISQAQNRNITVPELSDIKIIGENLEDSRNQIELCVSELENIRVNNISVKSGKYCSGCFKQAYHLLNFMKTYMGKDLKYNIDNSLLVGKNPIEPEKLGNILLFGDCSINSTMNYTFRKIIIESKKKAKKKTKIKVLNESKSKKKVKIKKKPNKNILNLFGCPPNIFTCLELILKYYGKKNVPSLYLFVNLNKNWITGKAIDKLKSWEVL